MIRGKKKKRRQISPCLLMRLARINEFEARAMNNANIVNRASVEAASNVRFSAEIQDQRERGQMLR